MSNKLTRTAPKRIWLQISDEDESFDLPFPHEAEVTWCADSVQACEVEYVRADLVRAALPANWRDLPETRALGRALGESANTK